MPPGPTTPRRTAPRRPHAAARDTWPPCCRPCAAAGRPSGQEKLLCLDIDGTRVDHDGPMTPPMRTALRRAAEEQVVVIATGRSIGATLPIVEAAGIESGYAVCSNGAVTVRMDPQAERGY